jgi:predicted phage-related endonuclease
MIERRPITTKAEWLQWRKADVTASAIGALFGHHPFTTALKLHLEKRGVNFANPDNRVTRRGRWLEPAVAAAVREERPGWAIEPANIYLRDGDLRLGATPDFFIAGDPRGRGVLQAKTTVPAELEKYWDAGREIPPWIAWQTRTEMMLADAAFGAVAVLVDDPFNMDIHVIEIARDTEAEAAIAAAVRQFWHDVERGAQPAADYGRDSDAIRALAGHEQAGKTLDLSGDNQLPELLEQRAALKARARAHASRCTEIENEIMHKLGDAERGVGIAGWHITFKSGDRAGYTVEPKTGVRTLRITDRRPPEQRPDGGEDI